MDQIVLPTLPRKSRVRAHWQRHVTATRTSAGEVFLLVGVRKSPCPHCPHGTVRDTVWGTDKGEGVRMAWCPSCFNATYDNAPLNAAQRSFWMRLRLKFTARAHAACWEGARPAIEHLERRGLL